ncbi:REP-associated tyrosine transposase [Biformimicrobium ophioploci]|uniref:Transposase n=1 Tax=Biformimicrobium ophioploci TaxID=3036711 RepID=A0ABQ6LWU1_9GAMM|nr:transposase [Microbulbifer sp. NKW57]GMG86560.1 transposase [Microbulbifer sp. NKW57]
MARTPRLYLPGCAQHVIQRGNNRQACLHNATDFRAYLSFLKDAAAKHHVAIHAFVLMTNHVHLLVTPEGEKSVSRMMQDLGRRYVQHFNYSHNRTGTLWEGRYKSALVDSENYLLKVYRYIEMNPVRAGIVSNAANYPWSSYQGNALGKPIRMLTPHLEYLRLGKAGEDRQGAYRALFIGRMPAHELATIREACNKGGALGDEHFLARAGVRAAGLVGSER